MKKRIFFLLVVTILFTQSYGQINFEQGYFIDNNDKKIACFIKNKDWKNNPIEFEYQLSSNDEKKTANIESVKEFGISGVSKYIRENVQIDRSSENVKELSTVQEPIFREEQLFLKVLLEGEASLFQYEDQNLKRYFYRTKNKPIKQLIYKSFKNANDLVFKNNQFRSQLNKGLNCATIKKGRTENLSYTKNKLIKFFVDYNECKGTPIVNYAEKSKKDLFSLTIRPGLNSSSLSIQNGEFDSRDTDFGNEVSFRLGLEAEFLMAFNKNKWAIIVEPTYQYFKSEASLPTLDVTVNYQSIELPIGVRHYFFLNEQSKIFLNSAFVIDFNSSKSIVDFSSSAPDLEIKSKINFAFGIGYKFLDRFSLEVRYFTNRKFFEVFTWSNKYRTLSAVVGYKLF